MCNVKYLVTIVLAAATSFLAIPSTVFAATAVYSGYDIGSTSLAGSPNATAAAAAFDSATGTISTINFETGLPSGVSASGGIIGDASSSAVCFTADLHCYATSSSNVYRNNGAVFTFANAINSFGAYFTGWQLSSQTITIGYSSGASKVLGMPAGNFAGGTVFFGFTDIGNSITSIAYSAGSPGTDAVGIDDLRFGNAVVGPPNPSPVPLPASLPLMIAGLTGLWFWRTKRC